MSSDPLEGPKLKVEPVPCVALLTSHVVARPAVSPTSLSMLVMLNAWDWSVLRMIFWADGENDVMFGASLVLMTRKETVPRVERLPSEQVMLAEAVPTLLFPGMNVRLPPEMLNPGAAVAKVTESLSGSVQLMSKM